MRKLLLATVCVGAIALSGCNMGTNRGVGAVTGGVAGGLLGNTLGKGSGKIAATAVGAMLGPIMGSNVGASMDRPVTNTVTVREIPVASCSRYNNNSGAKAACERGRDTRARENQTWLENSAYKQGYGR